MSDFYLVVLGFLAVLACFDLFVGVSNDAVNFLNSALGCRIARFRTTMWVASLGVLLGATFSSGMMEIARSGVFHPQMFTFNEIMIVFFAVMIADVLLLDTFNSLGLPTSTTVSIIFELLGSALAAALYKIYVADGNFAAVVDYINTAKALTIISGILISVGVAFVSGMVVQYLMRLLFTFHFEAMYRRIGGIFGGFCLTAIFYFLVMKGAKGASFMQPEWIAWIDANTSAILLTLFIGLSILFSILLWTINFNIFRIVILSGTFSLAFAFAGNDLVNFVGVPLAALDAVRDFMANGTDGDTFMMTSLAEKGSKAATIFLLLSGLIMVLTLWFSKKAHRVVQTSINLSSSQQGEHEQFGSSLPGRMIVRSSMTLGSVIRQILPMRLQGALHSRFKPRKLERNEQPLPFDYVRASVNLVLAGLLVALGTSLKLPLSTTYVTFMVAMGSSLADRAWGRESAVFRITGVISVIGGWFLTAGAAFISCAIVLLLMYYGGIVLQVGLVAVAITILVRSNIRYRKKVQKENEDVLFSRMVVSKDKSEIWDLLCKHVAGSLVEFVDYTKEEYSNITNAFINEDLKSLRRSDMSLRTRKSLIKKVRRKEMIGLQRVDKGIAIEKNTWFHLGINSCLEIYYCLRRICEPCEEHVDNNFEPLPKECIKEFIPLRDTLVYLLEQTSDAIKSGNYEYAQDIRMEGDKLKESFSVIRKIQMNRMQDEDTNLAVSYVYLNMLQESQEIVASLRHLLRAANRFKD